MNSNSSFGKKFLYILFLTFDVLVILLQAILFKFDHHLSFLTTLTLLNGKCFLSDCVKATFFLGYVDSVCKLMNCSFKFTRLPLRPLRCIASRHSKVLGSCMASQQLPCSKFGPAMSTFELFKRSFYVYFVREDDYLRPRLQNLSQFNFKESYYLLTVPI